jgi:7-cyano-7-deazaguanine synthase
VETVGFDYGQRHAVELHQRPVLREALAQAFPAWAAKLGPDRVIDVRSFGAIGESALTSPTPVGPRKDGLPSTFVPGRNLMFLVYAAALAERRGLARLVTGVCETDYSGYPDCRQTTIDAMASALRYGLDQEMPIDTPLMRLSKAQTWRLAADIGGAALVDLILEHSHTCYAGDRVHRHSWGYGCGVCPACELRAAGWMAFEAPNELRS